jgi:site-specific recombinase XerD
MTVNFHSLFAEDISHYLQYKRALGRKFDNEEKVLRLLDKYLVDQNICHEATVQPALIDSFLLSRPRNRPRSYNHLLGVTRGFFDWLVMQERLKCTPVTAEPRRTTSQTRPFLFEPSQIAELLSLTAHLPDQSRALHRSRIYSLIFALMYGLGLRVGEVVRLQYDEVDLKRQLLVINKSKFGKTRLVPFGPKVGKSIAAYLVSGTDWYDEWKSDDPVFSFSGMVQRKPIRIETVSQTFHKLMLKLSFIVPPGVRPPHLHCLRHSFAVETLLRWYRTGMDPNQRLFHLSTFMGHVDPSSTAWYLTITDALFKEANQRFEDYAKEAIS